MNRELIESIRALAAAATSIDETAAELAELIRDASGRRWVGLYRVTVVEVVNLAWSGPAPPAHPVFPVDQGLTGAAVSSRTPVCSNDVGSDPRYLTNQPTTGSELIVPILLGGEVVGTLDVEEDDADAFTTEDEQLFEEIGHALSPLYGLPEQ
jgi:L-methionine (R)-S-oxide reductase